MKFGIYLPRFLARPAGVGIYIDGLCAELLLRHPSCVLFTEEPGPLPLWSRSARIVRSAGQTRLAGRLPAWIMRPLLFQAWLRRQLGKHQIDVLLVPFHDGVYRCPAKQIIVVHDLNIVAHPEVFPARLRWYTRRVFLPILRATDQVVAVSEHTRRDLIRHWSSRDSGIAVVGEGCDRAIFRPRSTAEIETLRADLGIEDRRYLLYSGTLAAHKNLGVALRAFAAILDRVPDLDFVVTTDCRSAQGEALRREILALDAAGRVRLIDYVDRPRLGVLMAGAEALVFPSLHEGFGLVALEAMSCGTPVLAANRTSLPEVVGEGGILLDPRDTEAWSAAMVEVTTSLRLRADLRRRALTRAAEFTWERAATEILDIATRLAQPPRVDLHRPAEEH